MENQKTSTSSINPYNGKTIRRYSYHTADEIAGKITKSAQTFRTWRNIALEERCQRMLTVADILEKYKNQYGRLISSEMGKPIAQAEAEVHECAWTCRYYAEHAQTMLKPEIFRTHASESHVRYDPLGPVLAVMPWNYPFWQVFRFVVPNL